MAPARIALIASLASVFLIACDRAIEPFDPSETPSEPDLSRIFPERAAEQSAAVVAPGSDPINAKAVRGEVRLADALVGDVAPGSILFLLARSGGAGPPLAVKRITDPSFPYVYELGPDDRMIAERPFEGPLSIEAWLDRDGNVSSRGVGDFEGSAEGSHAPGETGVNILIDHAL